MKGDVSREANESGYDWGPTLELTLVTTPKDAPNRFKYALELEYDDSLTRLHDDEGTHVTHVSSGELRYAKIHALSLFGYDFKEHLAVTPYVSGGVQRASETSTNPGQPNAHSEYWSPTWGVGLEASISEKLTLSLDYDRNGSGGDRRLSRLSLELKLGVF